MVNITLI
jgi:hypothetical protein